MKVSYDQTTDTLTVIFKEQTEVTASGAGRRELKIKRYLD
jgi:hypothetical protein